MRIHLSILLLIASTVLPTIAQQSPESSSDQQNPPKEVGTFQCGGGTRYAAVTPVEKYLEKGDSWGGPIAQVLICGGCDFADTPAHPKPNPPQYKTSAFIDWGDGSKSDLELWQPDGWLRAAPHQYTSVIDPSHAVKVTMHAWCVNLQANWPETVTSTCDVTTYQCVPSPANVTVFKNVPPSLVKVVQTVRHGQIARGALSVVMTEAAPQSGTKVTLESSSDLVTFREPVGGTGVSKARLAQKKIVTITVGKSAANFDIDATAAPKSIKNVKITVSNAGGPPIETKFDVK